MGKKREKPPSRKFGTTNPINRSNTTRQVKLGVRKDELEIQLEELNNQCKFFDIEVQQALELPGAETLGEQETSLTSDDQMQSTAQVELEKHDQAALAKAEKVEKIKQGMNKRGVYGSSKTRTNNTEVISTAAKIIKDGKAKFQSFRLILPAGIDVDDKGNESGTILITKTPAKYREGATPVDGEFLNLDYAKRLEISGAVMMQAILPGGGLKLTKQAGTGDLGRLQIEVCYDDGRSFRSSEINEAGMNDKVTKRTEHVARAMNVFAGFDENKLFVLSSIVNQATVQKLQACLSNEEGTAINSHLRIPKKAQPCTILRNDGSREWIDKSSTGISSAQIKLYRDGADIVMSINWTAYFMRQRNANDELVDGVPMAFDDAIGVHFKTELRINEAAAADGRLIVATEGFEATFFGRLDWNAE